MAIEEPSYTVIAQKEKYEIRQYAKTLIAETTIADNFENAGNKGFRILAAYIFGGNKAKTKIAMTAPVSQTPQSEKIAMTAPVNQLKSGGGYLVQFTMPAKYSMDSLPEPNDTRVKIREVPARKVAVFRYSGSWSESRYHEKLEEFLSLLKQDKLATKGEPVLARFNSPFQLWFLRRNEIWIETE